MERTTGGSQYDYVSQVNAGNYGRRKYASYDGR